MHKYIPLYIANFILFDHNIILYEKRRLTMYTLPKDPVMLLSFVNMKLRDEFSSLDELAAACSTTAQEIKDALGKINYEYNEGQNQFK